MKKQLLAAAAIAFCSQAALAFPASQNTCSLTDVAMAVDCQGSFAGNNSGNATPGAAETLSFINSTWGFNFTSANVFGDLMFTGGNTGSVNLGGTFAGEFVLALKAGTGFSLYKVDGGAMGVSSLSFSTSALSNKDLSHATVYGSPLAAVPEPETYAMLLAGLGVMGFIARRRKAS